MRQTTGRHQAATPDKGVAAFLFPASAHQPVNEPHKEVVRP
jgi:hypothetical protein